MQLPALQTQPLKVISAQKQFNLDDKRKEFEKWISQPQFAPSFLKGTFSFAYCTLIMPTASAYQSGSVTLKWAQRRIFMLTSSMKPTRVMQTYLKAFSWKKPDFCGSVELKLNYSGCAICKLAQKVHKNKKNRLNQAVFCVITTALIQFNFPSAFEPTGFINGFIWTHPSNTAEARHFWHFSEEQSRAGMARHILLLLRSSFVLPQLLT